MSSSPRNLEVGFVLFWGAVALLGIYAATVLAAAVPLKLFDPIWTERVAGSLRGGVSFPLIALALLLLSAFLADPDDHGIVLTVVGRLAYLAAVGFFLLIPLQTWASMKVLHQTAAQEHEQLQGFNLALERIRLSRTEEQLNEAIQSIPGSPSFRPGSLTVPLAAARQSLILQIEPQLRQRSGQLQEVERQRWQEAPVRLIKEAVVSLFAALGFAAAGRWAPHRPTMLEGLLFPERRRLGNLASDEPAMAGDAEQDDDDAFDENHLYP